MPMFHFFFLYFSPFWTWYIHNLALKTLFGLSEFFSFIESKVFLYLEFCTTNVQANRWKESNIWLGNNLEKHIYKFSKKK